LANPGEFLFSDFGKFDRPPVLHTAFKVIGWYYHYPPSSFQTLAFVMS
jgi:hypothetical protein